MTTKAQLHHLIDELPDHDLDWVAEYIEKLHTSDDPRLPSIPCLTRQWWDLSVCPVSLSQVTATLTGAALDDAGR